MGPGTQVGAWVLEREIARGGQGAVFAARHGSSGQRAAVKLLLEHDPDSLRRFRQEARVLTRLRHPNVVRVLEDGVLPGGVPYLVSELVQGHDLRRLHLGTPLGPAQIVQVLAVIADTLHACHRQGVVHRDVKPENVLLEQGTDRPVLIDFGLIKRDRLRLAWSTQDGQALTSESMILGTPSYMAPEQLDPRLGEVGPLCDVYGLGATLYFLLTGAAPFEGRAPLEIFHALVERPPPDPRLRQPAAPDGLAELCLACLAKDPRDRPASAELLAAELRAALSGPGPRARRASPGWQGAALGACALAAGLGVWIVTRPGPPAPTANAPPTEAPPLPPARPAPPAAEPEAPAAAQEDEARRVFEQATAHLQGGDREGARALFERVLALRPDHSGALMNLGVLARERGELTEALASFDRVVALSPGSAPAWANRAGTRIELGDPRGALADLDRALEIDPRMATARANRAFLRSLLSDDAGAQTDLERVAELDPDAAQRPELREHLQQIRQRLREGPARRAECERLLEVALGLFQRGQLVEAERALTHVLELEPAELRGLCNRGMVRCERGDLAGALADLDRAVAIAPTSVQGLSSRAAIRRKRRDLAGARADLDRVLELEPGRAISWNDRGMLRVELGDQDGALADFEQALRLDPGQHLAWINRATVHAERQQLPMALEDLNRALELRPDSLEALQNRAVVHLRLRDPRAAAADCARFLELAGPDHPGRAEVQAELDRLREAGTIPPG